MAELKSMTIKKAGPAYIFWVNRLPTREDSCGSGANLVKICLQRKLLKLFCSGVEKPCVSGVYLLAHTRGVVRER